MVGDDNTVPETGRSQSSRGVPPDGSDAPVAGSELTSFEPLSEAGGYQATFDPVSTDPSLAAVDAVSRATERDPLDLPPVGRALDAAALDALVTSADAPEQSVAVTFSVADRRVELRAEGSIVVRPAE
ncbi:MAG: HalOD1 output domain-containing protein [Haloarculaceae archaeon]